MKSWNHGKSGHIGHLNTTESDFCPFLGRRASYMEHGVEERRLNAYMDTGSWVMNSLRAS
jgi:hypothetical protein